MAAGAQGEQTEAGLLIQMVNLLVSASINSNSRGRLIYRKFLKLTRARRMELLGLEEPGQALKIQLFRLSPSFLRADLAALDVSFSDSAGDERLNAIIDLILQDKPLNARERDSGVHLGVYENDLRVPMPYLFTADLLLRQARIFARDRSPVVDLLADVVDIRKRVVENADLDPVIRGYIIERLDDIIRALPDSERLLPAVDVAVGELARRSLEFASRAGDPETSALREFFVVLERCIVIAAASQQVLELPQTVQRLLNGG